MHGTELNRRTVESLIKAGAFDNLGSNRRSLVEATEGVLKSIESDSRKNLDGQIDLFSMMSGTDNTSAAETAMRSSPALSIPMPSCSNRRKRSAACTFPDIRWMPTGSSRLSLLPTPSKL